MLIYEIKEVYIFREIPSHPTWWKYMLSGKAIVKANSESFISEATEYQP